MSGPKLEKWRFSVLVSVLETQYQQFQFFVPPIDEHQNFATFTIGTFKNGILFNNFLSCQLLTHLMF